MIPISKLLHQRNFFLIAGPCAVESSDVVMEVAEKVNKLCLERDILFIFKSSYRKANRTKLDSFTGIGDEKALKILQGVKEALHIPLTTDIHESEEVERVAEIVDILQIPAFLCRQTALLTAAGKTGKIVSIKKGQFAGSDTMFFAAQKITQQGNHNIVFIERGNSFGYSDLVVDFRNIPELKSSGYPVVLDATHSLQRPNQSSGVTSGQPELIDTIASAGVACGVDGLFIETHPRPDLALSDGANMLPLKKLEPLLDKLLRIREAIT